MEFTFENTMPELTLEPELEIAEAPKPEVKKIDEPVLSPQEEKMVAEFAAKELQPFMAMTKRTHARKPFFFASISS